MQCHERSVVRPALRGALIGTASGLIAFSGVHLALASTQAGIEEAQNHVIPDRDFVNGDYRIEIELPEKMPEAFVCNCDKTAGILIEKLAQRGIRVPEDVSVVGFDDYKAQLSGDMKLTTYENDEKVIAQISMNTLLKRIEGRRHAGGVRIVEGSIVEGDTVKIRRT